MDKPQPEHDYLTLKHFIEKCPLSESTVRRRIKSGDIPSIQPGGRNTNILVPADALTRLEFQSSGDPIRAPNKDCIPNQQPKPRRRPDWMRGK